MILVTSPPVQSKVSFPYEKQKGGSGTRAHENVHYGTIGDDGHYGTIGILIAEPFITSRTFC